jgi:thioredoxin-related protein
MTRTLFTRRTPLLAALLAVSFTPTERAIAADPAGIVWRTDYATARKEAEQKQLPLLVVVGTSDCFYCRKLEGVTFTDPKMAKLIREEFIPLKIDATRNPEFAKALNVTIYPTSVLAATDGKIIGFLQGYLPPDQYLANSNKALALVKPAEKVLAAKPPLLNAVPAVLAKPGLNRPVDVAVAKPVPPIIPQPQGAEELLLAAREAFKAERYGECLERCEVIAAMYRGSPQMKEAAQLAGQVQTDSDRLAAAESQLDERNSATYLKLAETWVQKHGYREAALCLEKAIKLNPNGKFGEQAKAKLTELLKDHPTHLTGAQK